MSVNTAKRLEGKHLAQKLQEEIRSAIEGFVSRKLDRPGLIALQPNSDPASDWYLGQQEKLAAKLGIRFERVPALHLASPVLLRERISQFNEDDTWHGVFVAMPLPKGFDADILLAMNPQKDVEGIHPATLGLLVLRRARLIPPTAYAALALIEFAAAESGKNLRGLKAAIIGQSAVVGRPLALLLGERRVMTIVCNTGTSQADLEKAVSECDIVVACAGEPGIVKGAWVRPGAIVIDVGTTEVAGKLAGDVEFDEAAERAAFITPVPGGVGPLTVTMLMRNLLSAYRWQKGV